MKKFIAFILAVAFLTPVVFAQEKNTRKPASKTSTKKACVKIDESAQMFVVANNFLNSTNNMCLNEDQKFRYIAEGAMALYIAHIMQQGPAAMEKAQGSKTYTAFAETRKEPSRTAAFLALILLEPYIKDMDSNYKEKVKVLLKKFRGETLISNNSEYWQNGFSKRLAKYKVIIVDSRQIQLIEETKQGFVTIKRQIPVLIPKDNSNIPTIELKDLNKTIK
ncbi:MAG: hypothetical protein LBM71_01950 [Elusimicrobiota bacterium]|jgi:hypothetical protein|nr:hypothetical protein [Elusimicrobiota bacterium]